MNEVESSADRQVSRHRVAIIGSGPGGLVAARYLKHHGFEPVVFEQDDEIGGPLEVPFPYTGVLPLMGANTSPALTCFSDLAFVTKISIFPSNKQNPRDFNSYVRKIGN